MSPRYVAVLLLVVCAVPALAGCGSLDMDKIEEEIATGIEEQTDSRGVEVDCPDGVEAKDGDEFECDVTDRNGEEAKVEVVQTSDEGDIRWRLQPADGGQDGDGEEGEGEEEGEGG